MNKWPYNPKRANEHPGNLDKATEKQLKYISDLSNQDPEKLVSIFESMPDVEGIENLTKGQATFIIKCLTGEIKPYKPRVITEGAKQIMLFCTCGCDHITRSEVVNGEFLIDVDKCGCLPSQEHLLHSSNA